MTLDDRLLVLLAKEPGEHRLDDIVDVLKEPKEAIQKRLHSLTRSGFLAPRRYHITPCGRLGPWESSMQRRIFRALVEKGPLTRAQLLQELGSGKPAGEFREAMANADRVLGWLVPPACVLLTEKGCSRALEIDSTCAEAPPWRCKPPEGLPMGGKRWTETEEGRAQALARRGLSLEACGRVLKRSPAAVELKLRELGTPFGVLHQEHLSNLAKDLYDELGTLRLVAEVMECSESTVSRRLQWEAPHVDQ